MEKMSKPENVPQILIVDDVDANLMILENIILEMGYLPKCASSAGEAAKLIGEGLPQLILLDVFMPEMDGYEFCERLKENPITRDIPIIFISAADSSEDKVRGFKLGAVDYIGKPFEVTEVTMRVKNHLKLYEMQQELELSNRRLHSVISSQARRIEEEQKNILYALATLTEGKDTDTKYHLDNVAYNCRLLAQSLQFSPEFSEEVSESFIDTIEVASRLHDIGKIQTPYNILFKPGPLEPEEMSIVKRHVEHGAAILERVYANTPENSFLPMAIEIARYHHARWDGTGYPEELRGKNIPLSARITIIVDIYDTLLGERCYKEAYSTEESLKIIEEGSGTFFDPEIVDVFLKVKKQFHHEEG
ncbi:MAG: response regulator [Lachnospiraceae bacterium]|nr:response regulator [Lachnospiraceae bacterium]